MDANLSHVNGLHNVLMLMLLLLLMVMLVLEVLLLLLLTVDVADMLLQTIHVGLVPDVGLHLEKSRVQVPDNVPQY